MKKTLLFLSFVLFVGITVAQHRATLPNAYKDLARQANYVRNVASSPDLPVFKEPNSMVTSTSYITVSEDIIGTTWYDLQSNGALQNRIYCFGDGTIGATWTMGMQATAFPDRGTGYNYFDGSVWQAQPTARIENFRAGWPSFGPWGPTGEIVVSHDFTNLKLYFMTRPVKGTGTWNQQIFNYTNGPATLAWPRMITNGEDHNILHLLANTDGAYLGQAFGVLYSRSEDGGASWDIENEVLDGTGSDYYLEITADQYVWANPVGDTIAFLVASAWHDLFMMKSADNGNTWEKTVIWEHPYPLFDWNVTVTDTFFCVDNSASIALDHYGKAHVAFGINRVIHDVVGTSYNYFPFVDGIGYWNEDMPTFSNDLSALAPPQYGYPTSELVEDVNYIGWTQDVDGDGVITFITTPTGFPMSYREMGVSTMPTITVSLDNRIAVIYSSTTETYDNFSYNYKKLWMREKVDNTWGPFEHLTSDIIHIFDESIYPVVFPTWDGALNLIYNNDGTPGTALDSDHDYQENYTTCMNVDISVGIDEKPAIKQETTTLVISPNPTDGIVNAGYSINAASKVTILVSDISGRPVFSKELGWKEAGEYRYTFNLGNLSQGIYYVLLRSNQQGVTKKLVVN
jgi:hypothetical protein